MSRAYEVLVGNLGTVYRGDDHRAAYQAYLTYVQQSREGYGRAAGESVVWLSDDTILQEWTPTAAEEGEP